MCTHTIQWKFDKTKVYKPKTVWVVSYQDDIKTRVFTCMLGSRKNMAITLWNP